MPLDKVLHRIQVQINDLMPSLELFVDQTIQPSVNDCENLQKQLTLLQEQLAVYKYNKSDKELSPSFQIHAKVSEKQVEPVKPVKEEVAEPVKQPEPIKEPVKEPVVEHKVPPVKTTDPEPIKTQQSISVGINDKFRFINELFMQNGAEYSVAIEQLNNLRSWQETEIYLNSLKNLYQWKESSEVVKYFYSLVKKRFD